MQITTFQVNNILELFKIGGITSLYKGELIERFSSSGSSVLHDLTETEAYKLTLSIIILLKADEIRRHIANLAYDKKLFGISKPLPDIDAYLKIENHLSAKGAQSIMNMEENELTLLLNEIESL